MIKKNVDRRTFVETSGLALAALAVPRSAFAIGGHTADPIRIGVIGCGGRGSGAARDAVRASENGRAGTCPERPKSNFRGEVRYSREP